MLDDWLDAYMEYTDNTEPAEAFRAWTAISCIAACLRRKCYLSWGMSTYFPDMYIVFVAPSGGRKGTAMGPGFEMLQDLNIRMAAETTTREALVRALSRSSDTSTDYATGKQIFHSSLTIFSQELTVFLGFNNMQLMADLTDWFDCRTKWDYDTKDDKRKDSITNCWVNLFGATTPTLLQTTLPSDAIGIGLTSRIIFIYAAGKGKQVIFPTSPEELRPKLIHDLERISMLTGAFRYDKDFVQEYANWYVEADLNPPFTDERLAGYLERRPTHLRKLAMIMCAARTDDMCLHKLDFIRAKALLTDAEKKMISVFGGMGKAPAAAVTHRVMCILGEHPKMPYEELMRRFSHDVDAKGMDTVLYTLEQMKFCKVVNCPGIGKMIEVLPKKEGDNNENT
jgi:hypothetical protein